MKDKEKQITIKRGAGIMADLLNQEIEELQKAKAIEEMAIRDKLIDVLLKAHRECIFLEREQPYPCEGCKYCTLDRSVRGCIFDRYADAIIERGIFCDNSKLPENSVVLSKEEYDKFLKVNSELAVLEKSIPTIKQQASKETAEKILKEIYCKSVKHIKGKELSECFIELSFEQFDELAKQFGVEIKD